MSLVKNEEVINKSSDEEKRFQAALQFIIHRFPHSMKPEHTIEEAVKMADELLEHLEKTKK